MKIRTLMVLMLLGSCGAPPPGVRCPDACDDNSICTTDGCTLDGACTHVAAVAENGKSCGNQQVCNAGACTACVPGVACLPTNACQGGRAYLGVTSCATGTPTCVLAAPLTIDGGSSCDDGDVCTTADTCVGDVCVGVTYTVSGIDDCVVLSCVSPTGWVQMRKEVGAACTTDVGGAGTCELICTDHANHTCFRCR